MPFRTWVAGETPTAAMFNDYLQKQVVIVCTSGTRPGSPVEGMTIYETDTDRHAIYTVGLWQQVGSAYFTTVTTGWTPGTSYDALDQTLVLPAGKWVVHAKGTFDYSTTTARTYTAQLWNSTGASELDSTDAMGPTVGKIPFSLVGTLNITASATVQLRAKVSAVDGTQLLTSARLWAIPATVLS